jgi:hypothetical protein
MMTIHSTDGTIHLRSSTALSPAGGTYHPFRGGAGGEGGRGSRGRLEDGPLATHLRNEPSKAG